MERICSIQLENVNLKFRIYHDKSSSLKEYFLHKFARMKRPALYTDFYALKNFNLTINEGDRLGVLGLNGSGKSTLLKTVSRIYTPHSGKIHVSGRIAPLLEIGAGFNPEFTGRENIYLNGAMLGFNKVQMKKKEEEIIEFAGINEFIDMPVKYYSSGMYSRLAFTIATMVDPEILILDEIFAGGDGQFVQKATQRMKGLIHTSKIVILVSHSLEIIRDICNRCIIIKQGEIIADGKTNEMIDYYIKNVING